MSLINDMLKDIDRDQSSGESPMPNGLVEKKPEKTAGVRRFLLPGVALTAVAYVVLIEWNVLGIMPEKKSATMDIPQPIALNSKWLKQAEAPAEAGIEHPAAVATQMDTTTVVNPQNSTAIQDTSTELRSDSLAVTDLTKALAEEVGPQKSDTANAVVAEADITKQFVPEQESESQEAVIKESPVIDQPQSVAIQRLLDAATGALVENRLTTPAGDNAYQLYKSVLVIDPDNATARSGIETIRQRYLHWLDKALAENKTTAAQMYWQKARSVGVDVPTLSSYETALNSSPKKADAAPTLVTLSEATITPAIIPNDEELAERLRRDGLRLEQDALRLLKQMPNALQSPVALADLYVDRRAVADLRRLAELLKNQPAQNYVMAQLMVLDGQEQAALDALTASEFSGDAEQQRMRLLAGLRQKGGEHDAAMKLYATLVTAAPDNVSDWLGLAVSADKGKLIGTALNAYEKVLLLRHPDQRVMQYARQRQQDLSLAAGTSR